MSLEWRAQAQCLGTHNTAFFAQGRGQQTAKQHCAGCAVKSECLAHALKHHEVGVWGGTTDPERQQLRKATP